MTNQIYQNQKYEILIWNHGEDANGCLGDTDEVFGFDKYKKAIKRYNKISTHTVKMLMQYKSNDPASDGDVLDEDWNEKTSGVVLGPKSNKENISTSKILCDCCKIEFDSIGERAAHEQEIGAIGEEITQ